MLTVVERVLLLARGDLADAPTAALARIAAAGEEVAYGEGEALWEPGAVIDSLHLVLEGEVLVGERRSRRGELLDPAAVIRGGRRTTIAVAHTDAVVLRVSREDLWRILADEGELTRSLLVHICTQRAA